MSFAFEIKGPGCVFLKLMMTLFPSFCLAPSRTVGWGMVESPHFWPPEKEGLPGGCVLAEKGEPSGAGSHKTCCSPPGVRSARPDVERKGTTGTVVAAAGVPGSKPAERRRWQVRIQDKYAKCSSKLCGVCPIPASSRPLCAQAHTHTHTEAWNSVFGLLELTQSFASSVPPPPPLRRAS